MFIASGSANGPVNLDLCLALMAYSYPSNFTIGIRPAPWAPINGGPDIGIGGSYTTQAAADAAVAAFVAEVGYPWVAVGAVPGATSAGLLLVAINLLNVVQMADAPGSTGLMFNSGGIFSNGYAPWPNAATALTALLTLTGSVVNIP